MSGCGTKLSHDFPMKPPCPWSYSSPASHFDNTSLMSGSFDRPYGGSVTTLSTLLSSNSFRTSKQSPCITLFIIYITFLCILSMKKAHCIAHVEQPHLMPSYQRS